MSRQTHQVGTLLRRRRRERRDVALGHDHRMAVVVGIKVQDNIGERRANENQILTRRIGGRLAEDAHAGGSRAAGASHVREPPRRPEVFHEQVSRLKSEVSSEVTTTQATTLLEDLLLPLRLETSDLRLV